MTKLFLATAFLCASETAFSATYSVKVLDATVARAAFARGPFYIQAGAALKPDKIDYSKTYCYSWIEHFRFDPNKIYQVTNTTETQTSGTYTVELELDTQSTDKMAMFHISCMTTQAPSMTDVAHGLAGVYEVIAAP